MAIKYPLEYSLGSNKVQSFPRVQYAKIVEIIDALNGITDGTYAFDALTVNALTTTTASTNKLTVSKGTVTQGTNITTAVTVNAAAGVITTVSLTTAGGDTSGPFTVNNSYVSATSTIILTAEYASGKTGNPIVMTEGTPGSGTFKIKIGNGAPAATVLNDVVKIHFLVV
jgi:hypothetical protein